MSKYKLHAKKVNGNPNSFYIYLYKLESGKKKPILSALRNPVTNKTLKIENKYLLPSITKFQKISNRLPKNELNGFESVEELNKFLESSLHNFILLNGDKRFISNDSKYIDDYIDKVIERQSNQGTKQTYLNLKNIFLQFNLVESNGHKYKMLFRDLDTDVLKRFHSWLLTDPSEKETSLLNKYLTEFPEPLIRQRERNTNNSANDKLKRLKAVINSSHKSGFYIYNIHPFLSYTRKVDSVKLEILTIEDLNKLINTKYVEVLRRTAKTKDGKSLWGKDIQKGFINATTNEERNSINSRYTQKHSLEDIRNYWLFQLFSQGIRVSDLITLRWWDFKFTNELRIEKQMVKTRELINILVNDKMTDILLKSLTRYNSLLTEELSDLKLLTTKITKLHSNIFVEYNAQVPVESEYHKYCLTINTDWHEINGYESDSLPPFQMLYGKYNYPFFIINKSGINLIAKYFKTEKEKKSRKKKINPILDPLHKESFISKLETWYYNSHEEYKKKKLPELISLKKEKHNLLCEMIIRLSSHPHTKKDFVFTLLKNEDFDSIGPKNSFGNITENQYRKFQSARTYYNKILKLVSIQSDINKVLTTHLARHSYTSLMLELGENINLFDVMTSLGHKHLTTTQGYIRRFTNNKIDKLNQIISDNLANQIISI